MIIDPGRLRSFVPRPPQTDAAAAIEAAWAAQGAAARAQLRMACGVGKSMTAVMLAARTAANVVAVVTPTLDLARQTLDTWTPYLHRHAQVIAVCGDRHLLSGRGGFAGPQIRTTDPGRIGYLLEQPTPTLLVSTYASLARLAQAVRGAGTRLDLLVLDEAHHVAGMVAKARAGALDDSLLPSSRRLFMTATPVVATGADRVGASGFDPFATDAERRRSVTMDDEGLFGPNAFTYPTRQAITDGYLSDYEVLVVARLDTPSNAARLPLLAAAAAGKDAGARRILTFHNRVADARSFAAVLNNSGMNGLTFLADTIHGGTPSVQRRQTLQRLSGPVGPGVVRAVTSAQCLREGIDVGSVDAVLFAAPRAGTNSVVQCVGRALRTHPGKTKGTIVIPVLLPVEDGRDDDDALAASSWAALWRVLRALNAHDPDVSGSLSSPARQVRPGTRPGSAGRPRELPEWLTIVGGVSPDRIISRLVRAETPQWDHTFEVLRRHIEHLGSAHLVRSTDRLDGVRVGSWMTSQVRDQRRGMLDPAKAARLETLPGWCWTEEHVYDHRALDILAAHAEQTGTVRDDRPGPSRLPAGPPKVHLGRWMARTRRSLRDGTLPTATHSRCQALPGWVWEPLSDQDRRGVEAFASFVAWEQQPTVPTGHLEDGFELDLWLTGLCRDRLAGRLVPELADEIESLCPVDASGSPRSPWRVARTRIDLNLAALEQFSAREASASPPTGHVEIVNGWTVNLHEWVSHVRNLRSRSALQPEMIARLEAVPHWRWSARAASVYGQPITLPAGTAHGASTGATYHRCPCQACVRASRAYQTNYKTRQREQLMSLWSAYPPGVRRLRALLATDPRLRDVGQDTVAAQALGLPIGLVRDLLDDPHTPLPPWTHQVLAAIEAADLSRWVRDGTRGRTATRAGEAGDARAHQRRLEALSGAGWTRMMLACALGYAGNPGKITRPRPSATAVHALKLLVDALGPDLTPPSWARGAQDGGVVTDPLRRVPA